MPVIGINLNSINAKNIKEVEGKINVNSSPSIVKVKKHEKGFLGRKDVVSIEFKFESKYEPGAGSIEMEGEVLYQTDKADDLVGEWTKTKKLQESVAMEVLNLIFRRCLTKAVDLSVELRLPPPIQFPRVVKQEK
jgi:hypothetical protein